MEVSGPPCVPIEFHILTNNEKKTGKLNLKRGLLVNINAGPQSFSDEFGLWCPRLQRRKHSKVNKGRGGGGL